MHFSFVKKFKKLKNEDSSKSFYDYVMAGLFTLLVCCLLVVCVSQIAMRTKAGRVFLDDANAYSGPGIYTDYNDIKNCYVDVLLHNVKEQDLKNVSVYVNGEYLSEFTDVRKRIYVTSQSVIEIKNKNNYAIMCEAEKFGDGVEWVLNNGQITVKEMNVLTRVVIKEK